MPLKQTAIALCSCSSLYSSSCHPLLVTPPCGLSRRRGSRRRPPPGSPPDYTSPRIRQYAVDHHRSGRDADRDASRNTSHGDKTRPGPHWPKSSDPTPYEIFNIPKNAPYSKATFYQLVKLYHPDREHHTSHDGISHITRLERYRLIVAANNILSDPTRRRMYDLYGAGWTGKSDVQDIHRTVDRTWRKEAGNPSMNGTWEDWERWKDERDGKKQQPVYMSNGGFVALVIMAMIVGSLAQATRAGSHTAALIDQREQTDRTISRDMRQRHVQSMGLTRRDRVQSFLRQRESWEDDRHHGHIYHHGNEK